MHVRLKSDYSYSKDIVYNNFPWPESTDAQKAKIAQTAQAILDACALYPDSSLADLYDEVLMPPELLNLTKTMIVLLCRYMALILKLLQKANVWLNWMRLYKQKIS